MINRDGLVKSYFCSLYEHFERPKYSIALAKDFLRNTGNGQKGKQNVTVIFTQSLSLH